MITRFLKEMKSNHGALWVEGNELKVSIPKKIATNEAKQFILQNKEELISILSKTSVFDKQSFVSRKIYPIELKVFPLSFAQERLWFVEQYEGSTALYNIPMLLSLQKTTNIDCFKKSLCAMVRRHEVLRTTFTQDESGQYFQKINDGELEFRSEQASIKNIDTSLRAIVNKPFNLEVEWPIRVCLYDLKEGHENNTIAAIVIHHIAYDGWSADVFQKELALFYRYYREGTSTGLYDLDIQYKHYAAWQREYLIGDEIDSQLLYWKHRLQGFETLKFPTDKVRPPIINYNGGVIREVITKNLSDKIRQVAKDQRVTLYTVLLSGFVILLSKYTGQEDIILGTPVANRHYTELSGLIGFFINSLPVRAHVDDKTSIEYLIQAIHDDMMDSQAAQDVPFEKIVNSLSLPRDLSKHPIFQVLFRVQNFGGQKLSDGQESIFEPYSNRIVTEVARFDLLLLVNDGGENLKVDLNYATSLFNENTIAKLAKHYVRVLEVMIEDVQQLIRQVSLLCLEEQQNKLYKFSDTLDNYTHHKKITEYFEAQVIANCDNVSLIYNGFKLTYKELNEKANRLAHYIKHRFSIEANDIVALCLDRNADMVIAILAVLKSGGAYVPLDPNYPDERIKYIISDTHAKAVISNKQYIPKLLSFNDCFSAAVTNIAIDCPKFIEDLSGCDATNVSTKTDHSNLAYVIYTSGTTGKPKGVMVTHDQYMCYQDCFWKLQQRFIQEQIVSIFTMSYCFDASLPTLFSSILSGGRLLITDGLLTIDSSDYVNLIMKNSVNVMRLTPSMLPLLNGELKKIDYPLLLVLGGEPLDFNSVNDVLENVDITVVNQYGPTEAVVGSTFQLLENNVEISQQLIGKAYPGKCLYVLDKNMQLLPDGIVGELYIGGRGLAEGYLNLPQLTAERFLHSENYGRVYKTGDMVKRLHDGSLEYCCRNDSQIKIRGFRVELSEIEYVIAEYDSIVKCITISRKHQEGHFYLVCYYVSKHEIPAKKLLEYAALQLPEYMLPTVFMHLENIPLTLNDKIDYNSLPEPELKKVNAYVAPRNDMERLVCQIWQDILGVDQISVDQDFFSLGGDSILSIRLSARLRKKSLNCNVKLIFECRTVENICAHLSTVNNTGNTLAVQREYEILTGRFSLLPVQQAFFDKNLPDSNHYNQSFLIKVPDLVISNLQSIISKLVDRHDALRLQFIKDDNGNYIQEYRASIDIPIIRELNVSSYTDEGVYEVLTAWQSKFGCIGGDLWSIGYLNGYDDGSARVYLAFHHLIIDTISWRILTEDIKNLFHNQKLEAKGTSYRQWVAAIEKYAVASRADIDYWYSMILGQQDYSQYMLENSNQSTSKIKLRKTETNLLLRKVNQAYHTEINDVLLTALTYALYEWNGFTNNYITLEGHGREEIDESIDLSHTIGWFTTHFPVKLSKQNSVVSSLKAVKECLRNIPDKGLSYSALKYSTKVSENNKLQEIQRHILPPISFNYLGQFDSHADDGLWQIAKERSGKNVQGSTDLLLSINGLIIDDCLQFNFTSSLAAETTEKIAIKFKAVLDKIIQECSAETLLGKSFYTPSDFHSVNITQKTIETIESTCHEIQTIYPATSLQQGFIYHVLSYPEDDAYRIQVLFDYKDSCFQVGKFKSAWLLAIEKYPILRAGFNWDDELIQIIFKTGNLSFYFHDVCQELDKNNAIEIIRMDDSKRGFDLTTPTQLRVHVIKQDYDLHTVIISQHHIIAEGWSGSILRKTVHNYYQQLVAGEQVEVTQDKAYLKAQEYYGTYKHNVNTYWQKEISQVHNSNDLSCLLIEPTNLNSLRVIDDFQTESICLTKKLSDRLKELAARESITLHVLLQFAWHKMIQLYTGDITTIVGTITSGREIPVDGIEKSVGSYLNTLPLIVSWQVPTTFTVRDQLIEIHKQVIDLNNNSFVNLSSLQSDGERLFHTLFIFENYPLESSHAGKSLNIKFRKGVGKINYPFSLVVYERSEKITFLLDYASSHVSKEKITEAMRRFEKIITMMPDALDLPLVDLHCLDDAEYKKILKNWSCGGRFPLSSKTIIELFEKQVSETPATIAISHKTISLSYSQLNKKVNKYCDYIANNYLINPNAIIAVFLDRSECYISAIFAVLKAGAAFLPVDPELPMQRIEHMLHDSNTQVILTQSKYSEKLNNLKLVAANNIKIIQLDALDNTDDLSQCSEANPSHKAKADSLAYVIYSSGTSGKPKGIMIEHLSVVNYVDNIKRNIFQDRRLRVDFSSSVGFDLTVTNTLGAILCGQTVSIYSGDFREVEDYKKYLFEEKIEMVKCVPSYLRLIEDCIINSSLKIIMLGGEKLDFNIDSFLQLNDLCIYDEYGPTEATVGACISKLSPSMACNIGRPYSNFKAYVLDSHLNPVVEGVAGELYLSGISLARGYLNRPDLTNDRFITNVFQTDAEKSDVSYNRLYKTGDLVKWLPNGHLEFIGRADSQINLHGFRIEPEEIQSVLAGFSGIKQSVVVMHKDSSNREYLVAYYVSITPYDAAEILTYLQAKLPYYMIPSTIIHLECMPVTKNGKLDNSALPNPTDYDSNILDYVAPHTETQQTMCKIWEEVLGVEKISIEDDFFKLGGDSILSIQLVSRLRRENIACRVRAIFDFRTIAKLCLFIAKEKNAVPIKTKEESGLLSGNFDLLPIQKWFFEKKLNYPNHWNQSFLIKVPELDLDKLKRAVGELVAWHDMLRVRYTKDKVGAYTQQYLLHIGIPEVEKINVSTLEAPDLMNKLTVLQSSFDIEHGPLWKIAYLYGYQDNSARVHVACHHLLIDAVSWRIIAGDLENLYNGKTLGRKATSYRQWVAAFKEYAIARSDDLTYWLTVIDKQIASKDEYEIEIDNELHTSRIELSDDYTNLLLKKSNAAFNTEINDLLLTALSYTLQSWRKAAVHHITLEGHGREEINAEIDISRTIGWFTTSFPVRLEIRQDFDDTIKWTKENLRKIPDKGLSYFALKYNDSVNSLQNHSLPLINFNYLGQLDTSLSTKDWTLVREPSGCGSKDNVDLLININGAISHGKLWFVVSGYLSDDGISDFCKSFKQNLENIINHCVELVSTNKISFTPSDFPCVNISQSCLDELLIDGNEIQSIYDASSLQKGFIYHVLAYPEDDAYRVQNMLDYYDDSFDVRIYKEAWNLLIKTYPILRTGFNWSEGLIQVIYRDGKIVFHEHDLSGSNELDMNIDKIQREDRKKQFDLRAPTQLRVHIIKQSEGCHTVIISQHHIISDGWSGPILRRRLHEYYHELLQGKNTKVYEDATYLHAQNYYYLHRNHVDNYWRQAIKQVDHANDLSFFIQNVGDFNLIRAVDKVNSKSLVISGKVYADLKQIVKQEGITLNVLLQFAWHKLISVYTGDEVTIVGTTISGREIPVDNIENSVGFYLNTLPLIVNWKDLENITLLEQIKSIHKCIIELNQYGFANLSHLQLSGNRLFHSLFVYENYPVCCNKQATTFNVVNRKVVEKVNYPFNFVIHDNNESLTIRLDYCATSVDPNRVNEAFVCLEKLLEEIPANLNNPVSDLSMLSADDWQKIRYNWNSTDKPIYDDLTIPKLFYEQSEKSPNAIALCFAGTSLTYAELNLKSNKLARHICKQYQFISGEELTNDTIIAISLERSLDMVIGILAILKTGGCYAPISPRFPASRIKHILDDTQSTLILTQRHLAKQFDVFDSSNLVTIIDSDCYLHEDGSNLSINCHGRDLAYIIYTSGSTGVPKGVMNMHMSLVNRLKWMESEYGFNHNDVILQKTPYIFDVSIWELLLPLICGARLVLMQPEEHRIPEKIFTTINQNNITRIHFVPSMFKEYISYILNEGLTFGSLRSIFCSGEALSIADYQRFKRIDSEVELYNLYGPTEAAIDVSSFKCQGDLDKVLIGSPIDNMKLYVLDKFQNPVPVNVVGELYISGVGLARGYLNKPQLTKMKFIDSPYNCRSKFSEFHRKLYKTGDLVRWLPCGNLEYIGRNDFQVKIRGLRIELGEIEYFLSSMSNIQQSVVLAKERQDGSKYLVGYYTAAKVINDDVIISHLSAKLPDYMIPSMLVYLDELPLTINGKLDRSALLNMQTPSTHLNYVAPKSEFDATICKIFQEVLDINNVGIQDDFFRIGGDSILSIMLVYKLRKEGMACTVKDVFDCRTVESLSLLLQNKKSNLGVIPQNEQGILSGSFNLLPIQQWFFNKKLSHRDHWNQSFLIKVPALNIDKLYKVLHSLADRHDMLRVRYNKYDGKYQQSYYDKANFVFDQQNVSDYSAVKLRKYLTSCQSNFNIEKGPLWYVSYLSGFSDGSQRIFFSFHHLIIDSVSWRILIEDVKNLYCGELVREKGTSYRQWVMAIEKYALLHTHELPYWCELIKGQHDYKALMPRTKTLVSKKCKLSMGATELLLRTANKAYNTEINDLLLTALAYALKGWNGYSINHITLEGHGREEIDDNIDLSHTVGWCTTSFPVKLVVKEKIADSIKSIKECLRMLPYKGLSYGALKYCHELSPSPALLKLRRHNLPEISFNYLGQFDSGQKTEDWQLVKENSGDNSKDASDLLININGMIVNGCLSFNFVTYLTDKDTDCLTVLFNNTLEKIIRHCADNVSINSISYTPSDFNDFEPYVVVGDGCEGADSTLFMLPPADGGAESYFNNVVPCLQDKKLVIFNNFFNFIKEKFGLQQVEELSYEELSSYYIAYIKNIQPQGPYNLFGWSFGGVLAFEIARQLVKAGDRVANLILVDPFFNAAIIYNKKLGGFNHNDINYKYNPGFSAEMCNTDIVLYKATKAPAHIEGNDDKFLTNYYARNVLYNYLDELVDKDCIKVIKLAETHSSWINNESIIKQMCADIVLVMDAKTDVYV